MDVLRYCVALLRLLATKLSCPWALFGYAIVACPNTLTPQKQMGDMAPADENPTSAAQPSAFWSPSWKHGSNLDAQTLKSIRIDRLEMHSNLRKKNGGVKRHQF